MPRLSGNRDQVRAKRMAGPHKELYRRQIEATGQEIDALVCELYGLTEEETAIVEGQPSEPPR